MIHENMVHRDSDRVESISTFVTATLYTRGEDSREDSRKLQKNLGRYCPDKTFLKPNLIAFVTR